MSSMAEGRSFIVTPFVSTDDTEAFDSPSVSSVDHPPFDQVQQLPLHLRAAAAQARQFDARILAGEMALGLHQTGHSPLEIAHDLPVTHRRRLDAPAAGLLVGRQIRPEVADAAHP